MSGKSQSGHREQARSHTIAPPVTQRRTEPYSMKRYEKFADDIAELIRSGVLGPGQRVPSVRYAS